MIQLGGIPVMNTPIMQYIIDDNDVKKKEEIAKKFLDSLLEDPEYKKQDMIRRMRDARAKYESNRARAV